MEDCPKEFFESECVRWMPPGTYMVVRGGVEPARPFDWGRAEFCEGRLACQGTVEYHAVLNMKVVLHGSCESDSRRLKSLERVAFWNRDDPSVDEANRMLEEDLSVAQEVVDQKRHLLPSSCNDLDLNTAHWMGDAEKVCHALVIRVDGYEDAARNKTTGEVFDDLLSVGVRSDRISTTILANLSGTFNIGTRQG